MQVQKLITKMRPASTETSQTGSGQYWWRWSSNIKGRINKEHTNRLLEEYDPQHWKHIYAVGKQQKKRSLIGKFKRTETSECSTLCIHLLSMRMGLWSYPRRNTCKEFFSSNCWTNHSGWQQIHSMKLEALSLADRESFLFPYWEIKSTSVLYHTVLFCPIPAILANTLCTHNWKCPPGSCSSLQLSIRLNSIILTYKHLQTALNCTICC